MTKGEVVETFGAEMVDIDSIAPHPKNYRQHDVGAISLSLSRFGQTKPVVVQASNPEVGPLIPNLAGYIVAGSGTWKAAKALGWKTIAARFFEWDDQTAEAYLIADNRLHELGLDEEDALASLLTSLAEGDALEGTGYEGDDVDDLLTDLGKLPKPKAVRRPREVTCPECGHKFSPKEGKRVSDD